MNNSSHSKSDGDGIEGSFEDISKEIRQLTMTRDEKGHVRKMFSKNRNITTTKAKQLESEILASEELDRNFTTQDDFFEKQCQEMAIKRHELKSKSKEADDEMKKLEENIAEEVNNFSNELSEETIGTLDRMCFSIEQSTEISIRATLKAQKGDRPPVSGGDSKAGSSSGSPPQTAEDMPAASRTMCSYHE